ncbi:hypothetical protein [Kytococcus sedentarius]|uniref:hypothetical protein n=1 Tax=Kytococcus sedentarius TaxID=1276 RepID=UPI0035BC6BE4
MNTSLSTRAPRHHALASPQRLVGIDAARGLAVLTMFVAHFAPSGGPGGLLGLSEFLAAPLFVAVMAVGAHLSYAHHGWAHMALAMLPRAAILWAVGLVLEEAGAQIDVVLGALAVTALCLPLLVPLPSWALGLVGVGAMLVGPALRDGLQTPMLEATVNGHRHVADLLGVLGAGPHYRLAPFIAYAALAILVARHAQDLRSRIGLGVAGLALAGALMVLNRRGNPDFQPYDGSVWATLTSSGLVMAALLACVVVGAAWPAVAGPLATVGRTALTVYALQIVAAAAWVRVLGHRTDNSWLLLGACGLGAWVVAALWQALLPGRGPLELVSDGLAGAVRSLLPTQRRGTAGR